MLAAYNQETGDFAFMSVGPQVPRDPGALFHPFSGVLGTSEYKLPTSVDELRQKFQALTIQTTPEVAQQAIDAIRGGAGTGNWAALGNNCASSCVKLLKEIGLSPGSNLGLPWTPERFWENIKAKYGNSASPFASRPALSLALRRDDGQDLLLARLQHAALPWKQHAI